MKSMQGVRDGVRSLGVPDKANHPWDNLPMYLLFEETGKFLAGRVLSEADTSA